MTKNAFLSALEKELRTLPPEERNDAMQYYKEYFEEAGPEQEEKAARSLGSPKAIAADLLAASPNRQPFAQRPHTGGTVAATCLLAFLAFVLAVCAAALLLTGVCMAAVSIYAMTFSAGFGIILLGAGLLILGLGGISAGGTAKTAGKCAGLFKRRAEKGGSQ